MEAGLSQIQDSAEASMPNAYKYMLMYFTIHLLTNIIQYIASLRVTLNSAILKLDTVSHPHFCMSAALL